MTKLKIVPKIEKVTKLKIGPKIEKVENWTKLGKIVYLCIESLARLNGVVRITKDETGRNFALFNAF